MKRAISSSMFASVLLLSTSSLEARNLEIVAHRGANHLTPENTFAAAEICVDLGIGYVEIDVRTSRDGVLYVIHDSKLDRRSEPFLPIKDGD